MFRSKNQTDAAIEAALAKADAVLGDRNKIEAAIAKTSAEVQTTEVELEHALERLAAEEADVALAEDNAGERESAAQRSVQNLRLRVEAQQARLRGLGLKLIEQEAQVLNAQDELIVERDRWARARVAEFESEYRRAVEAIAAVLRKGAAVGDALGVDHLSGAVREARLCDLDNLSRNMLDMEPTRTDPASGMIARYPVWQDEPAAVSVYNALAGPRLKAKMLDDVANQIRQRRDEAARAEQRRRFESTTRPKTVGYQVHYPPEYSPIAPVER